MSRELTAWACITSFEIAHLVSGRFFGKWLPAWARLGPLSMSDSFRNHSYRRFSARFALTLAQQGGLAVSRLDGRGFSLRMRHSWSRPPRNNAAWRFPDWTAVGFASHTRLATNVAGTHS